MRTVVPALASRVLTLGGEPANQSSIEEGMVRCIFIIRIVANLLWNNFSATNHVLRKAICAHQFQ